MRKKNKAAGFACSDAGNAELFAARFGDIVRFDHTTPFAAWATRPEADSFVESHSRSDGRAAPSIRG
jgi:hypothetical protein